MTEGRKGTGGKRLIKMVTLGLRKIRDPYYHGFAAQLAFFYMLSLIPIALLLSQILFYFFETDIQGAMGWIIDNTRGTIADEIKNLTAFRSAGALNVLYIIIALWAASRAQFALTRITNFTFTDGQTTGRGFFVERIRSVFTMFITLFAMFAALVILIFGNKVVELVFGDVRIWDLLRWPLAFLLFVLLLSFMFYVMPERRWKFRQLIPGAVFSAIALMIVTMFYGFWVDMVVDYDIIYGALSNIVALMFWFYFFSWAICLGILTNKLLADTKDMDKEEPFDYKSQLSESVENVMVEAEVKGAEEIKDEGSSQEDK